MLSLLGLKGPVPSLLTLLGLVTLILCNFSVPFLASIKIFRVRVFATNGVYVVDYGLWGYCVPTRKYCTSPGLGFVINDSVAAALSMPGIQDALDSKHTTALIMYPIAVGSTLFTLICTVVLMLSKRGRCAGSWGCFPMTYRYARSLLAGYSLSLLTSVLALIVEISIVTKFKSRMDDFRYPNVSLVWGNVIWLTAIAVATNLYCYVLVWWLRKEVQDGVYCPQISKPHMQGPLSPQFTPQPPHPPPPPNAPQTFHNIPPKTSQSFHNLPHQGSQTFHTLQPQGSQTFHNAQPFPNYSPHPPGSGSFTPSPPPPPPPPPPEPEPLHSDFNPYAFHQPGYTGKEGSVHLAPPTHNPHEQSTSTPTSGNFQSHPGNPAYPQHGYTGYSSHPQGYSNYSGSRQ